MGAKAGAGGEARGRWVPSWGGEAGLHITQYWVQGGRAGASYEGSLQHEALQTPPPGHVAGPSV